MGFIEWISALAVLAVAGQPFWPCVLLLAWLVWVSRVCPPRYPTGFRGRKKAKPLLPNAAARASKKGTKPHWKSKPIEAVEWVIYLAVYLKSCRKVAATFNALHGPSLTVGHSWVAEVTKANKAEIEARRRAMRRKVPRLPMVGQTWALDLSYWRVSPNGPTFTMLGIIDHGSRRVLALKLLPRKCALRLMAHVFLAMADYGVPRVIYSDNEGMFRGSLWKTIFGYMGVRHRRSRVMCPWDNGVIERLFGHLKTLMRKVRPTTAKAVKQTLAEFTDFYNHVHRHITLKGRTPMEVWEGTSLAEVQANGDGGRWVCALDGLLVGLHIRC
jgi:putative transposase